MTSPADKDHLQRSTGVSSTEQPEKSQPDVNDAQTTGELGSEGGSYGDLTQQERTDEASDAMPVTAGQRGGGRAFGGLIWLVLGVCTALVLFWFITS